MEYHRDHLREANIALRDHVDVRHEYFRERSEFMRDMREREAEAEEWHHFCVAGRERTCMRRFKARRAAQGGAGSNLRVVETVSPCSSPVDSAVGKEDTPAAITLSPPATVEDSSLQVQAEAQARGEANHVPEVTRLL